MTADVFLVITAIANTSTALSTLKSLVTNLIEGSRTINDTQSILQVFGSQLDDSQAEFEIWKDFWGLNEHTSEPYQRILWGRHGEWVQKRLEKIQNVLQSIWQDLEAFSTNIKPSDRLKFVSSTTHKTTQNLSHARELLSSLKRISTSAYYAKHRIQATDGLSKQQLEEARSSVYVDLAMEARSFSRGLYESCYKASKAANIECIKLEVDLSRQERGYELENVVKVDQLCLHYHFLVIWNAELAEVLVEGLTISQQEKPIVLVHADEESLLCTVVEDIARMVTEIPLNFRLPYSSGGAWFTSRISTDEERILTQRSPQLQLDPVASLLYQLNDAMTNGVFNRFSLSRRLYLAFKIAEYRVLLAWTTWLSSLNCRAIERFSRENKRRDRFILETTASTRPFDEDDEKNFSQHIYRIGILLAETGLGSVIHPDGQDRLTRSTGDPSQVHEPAFLIVDPSSKIATGQMKSSTLQKRLEDSVALEYATAVAFCLEDKTDEHCASIRRATARPPEEAYKTVLAKYLVLVYKP